MSSFRHLIKTFVITILLTSFVLLQLFFNQRSSYIENTVKSFRTERYTPGQYNPEEAFKLRAEILQEVCKSYAQPLIPKSMGKGLGQLEQRRMFLLNHGLSVCIPDIEYSDLLTILFQQMFEDKSESDLSLLDPCREREMREKADRLSGPRQATEGQLVYTNPVRRSAGN